MERSHSTETRLVVIDTNVWLDLLVFEDVSVTPLFAAVHARLVRPVFTRAMRDELEDVLGRPALAIHALRAQRHAGRAATGIDVAAGLARFDSMGMELPAAPDCGLACRDPDDQKFLDLAIERRCAWLVSKDRALLDLARAARRRFGLEIVLPRTTGAGPWPGPGPGPGPNL